MKKYELTPEDRAQLKPWADKWITNAMSTKPMDAAEKAKCKEAVRGLYAAANLPPPRIVFVASPLCARFVAGFASAIWHKRKNPYDATDAATRAATDDATRDATDDATDAATYAATRDATDDATDAATRDATDDATDAATRDATDDGKQWFRWPIKSMVSISQGLGLGTFGLGCANQAWRFWQGGNQWSGWTSYLSFFRHVAKLPIDYSKWDHWEVLTECSGPRYVHKEFCIISDRPEILTVDEQNRPHNDTGPFCRWRDGAALYAIHGVRLPAYIVDNPERITVALIEAETNAEIRRIMIERYGMSRYLLDAGAAEVGRDGYGILFRKEVSGDEPIVMIKLVNSTAEPDGTFKDYFLRVPPTITTAHEAVAWTFGRTPETYAPVVET